MTHTLSRLLVLTFALAVTAAADGAPKGHYCNLGVFTPAELQRLEKELVPKMVAATSSYQELDDGYAFQLSSKAQAGEWIDLVRRCCPTLDYQLAFTAFGGGVTVRITGSPGAKAFIQSEFAPLFVHKI
jgi:hypothetical protein